MKKERFCPDCGGKLEEKYGLLPGMPSTYNCKECKALFGGE